MLGIIAALLLGGCTTTGPAPGQELLRIGDEIVVCGRYFHTGTPVVLWTDPGGYDAYRTERRFVPWETAPWPTSNTAAGGPQTPNRFGLRFDGRGGGVYGAALLSDDERESVRGGGWTLDMLQPRIDQFVIHYDVCGTSRTCFRVLHDVRGLSVHFMLDIDGTIYQTLDLKERAWHATTSNDRSIGIEIANIGAYPPSDDAILDTWYRTSDDGRTVITIPESLAGGGVRTSGFVGVPCRVVTGEIQGRTLRQFDLTDEQYHALIRLTATLTRVFPRIRLEYPREPDGLLCRSTLGEGELARFSGLLGHWHISDAKVDPGPALDWDRIIQGARLVRK